MPASDCRTLRGVIAHSKEPAAAFDAAAAPGTLWIERAQDGISFLSADPPNGWAASLTIAMREAWKPDAEGRAVRTRYLTLVLTAQTSALDRHDGQRFLRALRGLLEAPLLLLAS